ncbi:MAG: DUF1566 domain-containing protein [Proteobacteria bacterium]|nr:DUF1566 domain-containing protein [Pseudomonadota bacterium]
MRFVKIADNFHIILYMLAGVAWFSSCNIDTKPNIARAKETGKPTILFRSPSVAKALDTVNVTGKHLALNKSYVARFTLKNGDVKDSPISVLSSTSASFVMPEGLGLGEKTFDIVIGGQKINSMSIVADESSNSLDIFTGDASKICSTESYIDKTGAKKTGTKDCAKGTVADCSADGVVGCKTVATFPSVSAALATAANIKSGITLGGTLGTFSGSFSNCSVAGEQSCVASGTYFAGTVCTANSSACYLPTYVLTTQPLKAIDYDNISANAAKVRSGTTFGGVAGSLADCSTNGAQGCVTTATYQSGDLTNLTAGNIKSGVTIAGQAGDFPSATYTLSGASVTADLENANFDAQVKSATAFEYWTSAGVRQTGAGDVDIVAGNISNLVTVFGTTGSLAGPVAPNSWDVRVGTVINGVTGKLKVNCRNGATLGTFDQSEYPKTATADHTTDTLTVTAHGWSDNQTVRLIYGSDPTGLDYSTTYYVRNSTANTLQLSTTSGGAPIDFSANGSGMSVIRWGNAVTDIWDLLDDEGGYASAVPTYTGWSSSNQCGGIEATADDANVWKDVTTTGDGSTASTCTATAAHCSFKDKMSGQEWHKPDTSGRSWPDSVSYCDSLSYNGKTDWRLPTQKELMEAYSHGMKSTADSTNWITSANFYANYWTATTGSTYIISASWMTLANGSFSGSNKTASNRAICVRP